MASLEGIKRKFTSEISQRMGKIVKDFSVKLALEGLAQYCDYRADLWRRQGNAEVSRQHSENAAAIRSILDRIRY